LRRWRLEARRRNGELWERFHGEEAELREQAVTMGSVQGQKSWRFDLFHGPELKATYARGAWKETA
jgi:hypothetical protein